MKAKAQKSPAAPAEYFELVEKFPIRRLENDTDHAAACAAIEPLVGRQDLTRGQEMYLDALSRFIEDYEDLHHHVDTSSLTPVDVLKELIDQRDMNVSDLGKVIGSQPMASMILRGERGISKANIFKLAAHFHVDPSLFIARRPGGR